VVAIIKLFDILFVEIIFIYASLFVWIVGKEKRERTSPGSRRVVGKLGSRERSVQVYFVAIE
jgi:hypothetical protein